MKFQVITADFPWNFNDSLTMSDTARGASSNYNTMSNSDLLNLKIKEIADPEGCVLALWVPSSLLSIGLQCLESYGFEHKQTYIWVKTKKEPLNLISKIKNITKNDILNFKIKDILAFGMGRLFRQTHEICLIGINNKKIYKKLKNKSQRSVSFATNLKHSAKPDDLQDSLELMFPSTEEYKINYLELFARRNKKNWVCVGNQASLSLDEDINDSLKKLEKLTDKEYEVLQYQLDNDEETLYSKFWRKYII